MPHIDGTFAAHVGLGHVGCVGTGHGGHVVIATHWHYIGYTVPLVSITIKYKSAEL